MRPAPITCCLPGLVEARELLAVIDAAEKNLLADMRAALDARIDKREEVLP